MSGLENLLSAWTWPKTAWEDEQEQGWMKAFPKQRKEENSPENVVISAHWVHDVRNSILFSQVGWPC